MPTAITVPVSQLQDPVFLPASPQPTQPAATASAPGKPISVPVSQLQPVQANGTQSTATQTGTTGPTIGPSVKPNDITAEDASAAGFAAGGPIGAIGARLSMPIVKALVNVHDSLTRAQSLTQEGRTAHPIAAKLGDWANNIEELLTGGQSAGKPMGTSSGVLNNPVSAAILPGAEGEPAIAGIGDIAREGVASAGRGISALREGLASLRSAEEAPEAAETAAQAPSKLQQVLKGQKVEQAPAQSALRQAAGAGSDVQGIRTFLDKPLADLAQTERATYDAINKAAGTDLKSLYDHAEEVQDALDDPTNIKNQLDLQKDLAQTRAQIEDGENKALANGVSPDTLDKAISLTQKRYAGEEVARKLFNNESVVKGNTAFGADETVNVDSAIRNAEQLNKPSRFAPRGTPPRLQQWLGKDGADNLLQGLYDAKATGQSAVRLRKVLSWAGIGLAGVGSTEELIRRF